MLGGIWRSRGVRTAAANSGPDPRGSAYRAGATGTRRTGHNPLRIGIRVAELQSWVQRVAADVAPLRSATRLMRVVRPPEARRVEQPASLADRDTSIGRLIAFRDVEDIVVYDASDCQLYGRRYRERLVGELADAAELGDTVRRTLPETRAAIDWALLAVGKYRGTCPRCVRAWHPSPENGIAWIRRSSRSHSGLPPSRAALHHPRGVACREAAPHNAPGPRPIGIAVARRACTGGVTADCVRKPRTAREPCMPAPTEGPTC